MTNLDDVFAVIRKNHQALLEIKKTIDNYPNADQKLQALSRTIWPTLQLYGLRDTNGSIYDGTAPAVHPLQDGETENRIGHP